MVYIRIGALIAASMFMLGCMSGLSHSASATEAIPEQTDDADPVLLFGKSTDVPPTDTAAVSVTSTVVPTPKPNPYKGSWSISGFPFMLNISENDEYSVSDGMNQVNGVCTFDDEGLYLQTSGGDTVDLCYDREQDMLHTEEYELYRSNTSTETYDRYDPGDFIAENDVMTVTVTNAVADVVIQGGERISEYCFTKQGNDPRDDSADWLYAMDSCEPTSHFRAFKSDGSYALWVRDEEGNRLGPIDVTIASGYLYPIRAEGLDPIRQPLATILEEHDSSVDHMNEAIADEVASAGIYTREGVVTAAVSLVSHMAEYGYSVIYQGKGSYQAETDWGVNPGWGGKLDKPTSDPNGTYYHAGMQCVASIVWAYKQAGMNLSSSCYSKIGMLGEKVKGSDNKIAYDRAKPGDIVNIGGHYQMIVDRLDQDGDGESDSYLTYEMCAPHLTFLILTFRQMRGRTFFSMDAFFENCGRNMSKTLFWEDTFRIPQEDFPPYLNNALEKEEKNRTFTAFLSRFGL